MGDRPARRRPGTPKPPLDSAPAPAPTVLVPPAVPAAPPPDSVDADIAQLERARAARDPEVQGAINRWAEAGSAASSEPDSTNRSREVDAAVSAMSPDERKFLETYDAARERAAGQLLARRAPTGRSMLVPPACTIHPKLGEWGFQFAGKWMIIRWIGTYQRYRERRHREGYVYFEGREWCSRLGLNPEAYLNDRGRISTGDLELAWCSEERRFELLRIERDARSDMSTTVSDRLSGAADGRYVKGVEVLEGDDESVLGELRDRRRFAESR